MLVQFILMIGCTSPDKLIGDSNVFLEDKEDIPQNDSANPNPDTGFLPDDSTVNGILSGGASQGDVVSLDGLVVTTPSNDDGFYAADLGGGTSSGIWIQADFNNKGIFEVEVGEQISVTGVYTEVLDNAAEQSGFDTSESTILVSSPDMLVVPENQLLLTVEAQLVTTEELTDPATAESYEGVLVKIADSLLSGGETTAYLNGTLPVGQRFFQFDPTDIEPVQLEWIYGVIGYEAGQYQLFPRSEADAIPARNTMPDLTVEQFFVSEVYSSNSTASNCDTDLSWYLEIKYKPNNGLDLVADALYLIRYAASGAVEVSKITSESGLIDAQEVGIVTDVNVSTCLALNVDNPSVRQFQTEIVTVLSPVSGIAVDDEIHLAYAETVDDLSIGNHTSIQTVRIGSNLQDGVSRAFGSSNTPLAYEDSSNGSWCDSAPYLYNNDGDPLTSYYAPYTYHGTPGTYESHCQ